MYSSTSSAFLTNIVQPCRLLHWSTPTPRTARDVNQCFGASISARSPGRTGRHARRDPRIEPASETESGRPRADSADLFRVHRPDLSDRLDVEVALLLCQWFGSAVLVD